MKLINVLAIAATVGMSTLAAAPSFAQTAGQQDKVSACNAGATARSLTGDARRQFMSNCMASNNAAGNAQVAGQQDKMKSCNANAISKGLTGDQRRTYMSACMKG